MGDANYLIMKLELCNFSGYKIYPGHGKRFIRIDGKLFNFLSKKSERSFLMKRNPRKISWTVLYRKAQERNTRGDLKETNQKDCQIPTCNSGCIFGSHLGEEKYETRSEGSTEGSSDQSRER